MPIVEVGDVRDPRLADYAGVAEPKRLARAGRFIAEGRLVVRRLLEHPRHHVHSVLVTRSALGSIADLLDARAEVPVYVAAADCLNAIAGFDIHRGCLAVGERPQPVPLETLLARVPPRRPLVLLERVGNPDNLGGVFRNAAAFDVAAVLMSPGCADPLYRKTIRVSMGASLAVPFATFGVWPAEVHTLERASTALVALTTAPDARRIDTFTPPGDARLALLFGSEGHGLSPEAESAADYRVRIPIAAGVDSLNVAAACAVALHRLTTLA